MEENIDTYETLDDVDSFSPLSSRKLLNKVKLMKLNYKYIITMIVIIVAFIVFMQICVVPNDWIKSQTFIAYKEFFEVLSYISVSIGVVSLIFIYNTYKDTQIMNSFNATYLFNKKYSDLLPRLGRIGELQQPEKEELVADYLNLCNDQLSSIKRGLIPYEEQITWVNGIRDQINLFNDIEIEYEQVLYGRPYIASLVKIIESNPNITTRELINRVEFEN